MKAELRKYRPEPDFLRIRDLLVETYQAFEKPLNWRLERWNYARYFVAPMLGVYQHAEPSEADSLKAIRFWEEAIAVWENDRGDIAGVANIEHPVTWHPDFGEFFLQRRPGYDLLLGEMLDYAEANLADREKNLVFISVYDHDAPLQAQLEQRGYRQDAERPGYDSVFVIGDDLPESRLPDGYRIQSMADENDIEARREIFGRAFNHTDPAEWPSAFAYRELQRAPDYRADLDLSVISPDGTYAACCLVWLDAQNRMGILEPVGTYPDFMRMGLGREVVLEGVRRAAALDAERVWAGSGQPFYRALGFQPELTSYRWTKEL